MAVMKKKIVLTKILAILGTGIVSLPVLAPIVFSGIRLAADNIFRFDYLMPAELFPAALAGGGLLTFASILARSRRVWIIGGLCAAAVLLVGGQALAVATGLASGEIEPAGWIMTIVLGTVAIYALALLAIIAGGVLLLRDLFKRT
jgi:hypothetical protein